MTGNGAVSEVSLTDVRDVLRRQIGDASRVLRGPALSDAAIHHARKELKRARANLRLLRPALGRKAYTRENAALRDASRPLSGVRDARVIIETIDDLLAREKNVSRRALLTKVRGLLEQKSIEAGAALQVSGNVTLSAASLDQAWQRVNRWGLGRQPQPVMERALSRIYARARKALAVARAERSAESLHEWRKHVKYLGAALETLDAGGGRVSPKLRKRMGTLADRLGLDHDLVVLEGALAKLHSQATHARTGIISGITARRDRLQAKALKEARALFSRKPKAFLKHIHAV